jgi:hypothetical protein
MVDMISGKWVGTWGNRKNTLFFIEVIGVKFKGYYVENEKKIIFSGILQVQDSLVSLIFSQPMSDNSGGVYNYKKDTLSLYCDKIKGEFFRKMKDER